MGNRITLKRKVNKLELLINNLVCKTDFTSNKWDATTKSELDEFLNSTEGQERLSGLFQDKLDETVYYDSTNIINLYDSTNISTIEYVDESQS